MMRKFLGPMLIGGLICLWGALPAFAEGVYATPGQYEKETGKNIERYYEAPMLRTKVAAGELPSIEERLPEEPLVVVPYEEIGTYGGRALRLLMGSASNTSPAAQNVAETLLNLDPDTKETIPNIAKDWKFSEDGKVFTMYLRKGLKWSDGVPFTADDILFWYEDVAFNKEINPGTPRTWTMDGEPTKIKKVDDYTVELTFHRPFWSVTSQLDGTNHNGSQQYAMGSSRFNYLPKHAMKEYHIKYNPEANELAEKEGFESWSQLFRSRGDYVKFPDIPSLGPWHTKEVSLDGILFERNPYYFKVDTAGNQLPYIDEVRSTAFNTAELQMMKMITGQVDFSVEGTSITDYPVLKTNEEQGNYQVWLGENFWGAMTSYSINQNYEIDPVLGEILRDVRFRRALSLAINREEINELLAFGYGSPRQATVDPSVSFYEEEWGNTYAEYDPERANALLDEMDLVTRDREGYRLMSNGEPLAVAVYTGTWAAPYVIPTTELVKEYWAGIGVNLIIKLVTDNYLWSFVTLGKHPVIAWVFDVQTEKSLVSRTGSWFRAGLVGAVDWESWWGSDGEKGQEPPEEMKRVFELSYALPYLAKEERDLALKELCEFQVNNVMTIGTIGKVPQPCLANADLGNVNTKLPHAHADFYAGRIYWLEQMFWKN